MKSPSRLKTLRIKEYPQPPSMDDKEDDHRVLSFIPTEVVVETPDNESPPPQPTPVDKLFTPEERAEARGYMNRFYHCPLARNIYVEHISRAGAYYGSNVRCTS